MLHSSSRSKKPSNRNKVRFAANNGANPLNRKNLLAVIIPVTYTTAGALCVALGIDVIALYRNRKCTHKSNH